MPQALAYRFSWGKVLNLKLVSNNQSHPLDDYIFVPYSGLERQLEAWKTEHAFKVKYIRKVLKQSLNAVYAKKVPLALRKQDNPMEKFFKLPHVVIRYCLQTNVAPTEILAILYFCMRYIEKRGYARFKLKDLAAWSGKSEVQCKRAVAKLVHYQVLAIDPLHPNYVIAHGRRYKYGPVLLNRTMV